jgi:hypothetical protein
MSGAIPPLPQYAFTAWCFVKSSGTALPLPFTTLRAGDQGLIPGRGREFSLRNSVQTGSEDHPESYPMGKRGSFPGVKSAGA